MYERFTDRSRKVMPLASQEAKRFSHEYIGTEHLLLGLLRVREGVAAEVFKHLGVEHEDARRAVIELLGAS